MSRKDELKYSKRSANSTRWLAILTGLLVIANGITAYAAFVKIPKNIESVSDKLTNFEHELIIFKSGGNCSIIPIFNETSNNYPSFSLSISNKFLTSDEFYKYIEDICKKLNEGQAYLVPKEIAILNPY